MGSDKGFDDEVPVHRVTLAPFFISKYEVSQAQWTTIAGSNPSFFQPGSRFGGKPFTLLHPVENVTWNDCSRFAAKLALELPTEAQWEYAARAGTTTPWSTGTDEQSLIGYANLRDLYCRDNGGVQYWRDYEEWLDDGYVAHSPIGFYKANPWGLHDVHGNLWEWCREPFDLYVNTTERERDGERATTRDTRSHIFRSGAYYNPAEAARSSYRYEGPGFPHAYGMRPVRALDLE
jgi:formylglycine-generating enzyme required for sulfatase activity